jgi:hypothetical protein
LKNIPGKRSELPKQRATNQSKLQDTPEVMRPEPKATIRSLPNLRD